MGLVSCGSHGTVYRWIGASKAPYSKHAWAYSTDRVRDELLLSASRNFPLLARIRLYGQPQQVSLTNYPPFSRVKHRLGAV